MTTYRIRADVIWRKQDGCLAILDPVDRQGRFYRRSLSSVVDDAGVISVLKQDSPVIRYLVGRRLIEPVTDSAEAPLPSRTDRLLGPLNVTIQLTNGCNLTCSHCHDPGATVTYLPFQEFERIVVDLRAMGVFNVNLSGGEAMLHPRVIDMVALVWNLGMKVTMSTNCLLIDASKAAALRRSGLTQAHVSLDSHRETDHDGFRGRQGAYSELIGRLPHLRRAGIEYTLVTTLQGQSPADYAATIDRAFELGASAHKTNTMVPQGRATEIKFPDRELTMAYAATFKAKRAEYAGRFRLLAETMFAFQIDGAAEPDAPEMFAVGCPAGILTCAINERGLVMPCSFFSELTAGSATVGGFEAVWNTSGLFAELRHREHDETCGACFHQKTCGGCRARSFGVHRRLHSGDPFCSLGDHVAPSNAAADGSGSGSPVAMLPSRRAAP